MATLKELIDEYGYGVKFKYEDYKFCFEPRFTDKRGYVYGTYDNGIGDVWLESRNLWSPCPPPKMEIKCE